MAKDPRIDDYIAKAAPFAQPILVHLRQIAHRALPDAEEGIKWGMPHFMLAGKNVAGMAAFKAHVSLVVHGLTVEGEGMGALGKITSLADLPVDDELIALIRRGAKSLDAPKAKRQPKPELPVPPALAAALDANPRAKAAFASLAPSHRREYIEWIADAKRDATREKRVATAVAWLAEGKKRNWKYENC